MKNWFKRKPKQEEVELEKLIALRDELIKEWKEASDEDKPAILKDIVSITQEITKLQALKESRKRGSKDRFSNFAIRMTEIGGSAAFTAWLVAKSMQFEKGDEETGGKTFTSSAGRRSINQIFDNLRFMKK